MFFFFLYISRRPSDRSYLFFREEKIFSPPRRIYLIRHSSIFKKQTRISVPHWCTVTLFLWLLSHCLACICNTIGDYYFQKKKRISNTMSFTISHYIQCSPTDHRTNSFAATPPRHILQSRHPSPNVLLIILIVKKSRWAYYTNKKKKLADLLVCTIHVTRNGCPGPSRVGRGTIKRDLLVAIFSFKSKR